MGPLDLHYNYKDILRTPRLALSGKKIWILIVGNLLGYISYWILSYISLILSGYSFKYSLNTYGLYPYLFGNNAEWLSWLIYYCGITIWICFLLLSFTAISRITLKQLKGNDFFAASDGWKYVTQHWQAIIFSPIAVGLIALFFIIFACLFALISSVPYFGEIFFPIFYIVFFFGSLFTIYTFFVLIVSLIFTPSIVGTYEEDTMGTVFHSYSLTIGQPWRILLYHIILFSLLIISIEIFTWFWFNSIGFINYIFGSVWFMGSKLNNISFFATSMVFPPWLIENIFAYKILIHQWVGLSISIPNIFPITHIVPETNLETIEVISGIILSISYFLIGLSILSYCLSIISVGETLMFIIFKKKSDDDDLLMRKDEDEINDEDFFDEIQDNSDFENDENKDNTNNNNINED